MPRHLRATLVPTTDGWTGRIAATGVEVSAGSRARCLALLRAAAGGGASLTVEVTPRLAGVAEAAALLGWDRRRVITYVDRGSFPEPVARLRSGRVWRYEDVQAFARARARARDRAGRREGGHPA